MSLLPILYNTGIATFIWVVTNRKDERRKGKVQLIDATGLKSPLRKNLGNKNCELTEEIRNQIMQLYLEFEENEYSKIFNNKDFGYWKVNVERPLRLRVEFNDEKLTDFKKVVEASKDLAVYRLLKAFYDEYKTDTFKDYNEFEELLIKVAKKNNEKLPAKRLKLIRDNFTVIDENAERVIKKVFKKEKADALYGKFQLGSDAVEYEADKELSDTEQIPLSYNGGIEQFFKDEVLPFAPDAWIDSGKTQIGYEISFTKYFYKPVQLRSIEEIVADIKALEAETDGLLNEIIGG